jgi:hypothetical protein
LLRRLLRHQLDDVELFLGDTGGVPGAAEPAVVVDVGAADTDALELVVRYILGGISRHLSGFIVYEIARILGFYIYL